VKLPGIGRVDFLLAGFLIVEIDGFAFHSRRGDMLRDRHRNNTSTVQRLLGPALHAGAHLVQSGASVGGNPGSTRGQAAGSGVTPRVPAQLLQRSRLNPPPPSATAGLCTEAQAANRGGTHADS
jgi:hypothetical protein